MPENVFLIKETRDTTDCVDSSFLEESTSYETLVFASQELAEEYMRLHNIKNEH